MPVTAEQAARRGPVSAWPSGDSSVVRLLGVSVGKENEVTWSLPTPAVLHGDARPTLSVPRQSPSIDLHHDVTAVLLDMLADYANPA